MVRRSLDSPEASRVELNWNGPGSRSLTVHAARLPGQPIAALSDRPALGANDPTTRALWLSFQA